MDAETGEKTLLMTRPVRLSNVKQYIIMIVLVAIAIYLAYFRAQWFPAYTILDRWDVYTIIEIILIFIAFVSVIVAEFRRILRVYIVTNFRVIESSGLIKKNTTVMMTNKIERVYVAQGILQRMLRFGDVVVDTGEDQIVLASIAHPSKVEGTITQAMALRPPARR